VVRRQIRRSQLLQVFARQPSCLIGMEACASSHHWARTLSGLGRDVKLMPAQDVKPSVKRGKNDAADAEAICEAATRPTMRLVAIKSRETHSRQRRAVHTGLKKTRRESWRQVFGRGLL